MRSSRGSSPADPARVAAWEADNYPALRRHRDAARSTPVDDALPEEPWRHEAETRSALELIDGA